MRAVDSFEDVKKPKKDYTKKELEKIAWIEEELKQLDRDYYNFESHRYYEDIRNYYLRKLWELE